LIIFTPTAPILSLEWPGHYPLEIWKYNSSIKSPQNENFISIDVGRYHDRNCQFVHHPERMRNEQRIYWLFQIEIIAQGLQRLPLKG
jgi:hypothetical protein